MTNNRLATLAHYVIWRCDPADLGATKLNKVLWFADLESYRLTGRTITGAKSYQKRQYGPVPKGIMETLESLKSSAKISTSSENYFGFAKTMFMSLERPDISQLSAEEVAIVDMIAEAICRDHTAKSILDISHDALWEEIPLGGELPIGAAAMSPGEITPEDVEWAEAAFAG